MFRAKLDELKKVIEKEREMAVNPKRVYYSKKLKGEIALLTQSLSITKISNELGVSKSFIVNLKKKTQTKANLGSKTVKKDISNTVAPVQLLDLTSSLIKEEKSILKPVMKVNMPNGLSIEIFN